MSYDKLKTPSAGERVINDDKSLTVPNNPIIPFIEGDGIGPDIWRASQAVFDATVEKTFGAEKKVEWFEVYGEKSLDVYGENEWLPQDTLKAISDYKVAIKGPLTTPVGGEFRSINVALRQLLDLYACVRPVRYFEGVPLRSKIQRSSMLVFSERIPKTFTPASSGSRVRKRRSLSSSSTTAQLVP